MTRFDRSIPNNHAHIRRIHRNSTPPAMALLAACLATTAYADNTPGGHGEEPAASNHDASARLGAVTRDRSVLQGAEATSMAQFSLVGQATAVLHPTADSNVSGEVTFRPDEQREHMRVHVRLQGLSPGKHGFHIHAVGDCSASDASSAGGHFNPYNTGHGGPEDARHHLGDLGNVVADASGHVDITLTSSRLGFSGPASVLQKAVVVHAHADDLKSDPAGNAGPRVACGVINQDREVLSDSLDEAQDGQDEVERILPTVQ
ncbi:MAG: superoxide dismutase family protein [Halioglobus sp.]|nr:superoxide dismutase family protein [Halioglobus sp.]